MSDHVHLYRSGGHAGGWTRGSALGSEEDRRAQVSNQEHHMSSLSVELLVSGVDNFRFPQSNSLASRVSMVCRTETASTSTGPP